MGFHLTEVQKAELRQLDVITDDRFEGLIDFLENHMSEAYVKQFGSKSSPLLEAREKLIEIQRKSEALLKVLKSLTVNDQYRIKEIVGMNYFESQKSSSQSTRRRDLDIQKILAGLAGAAAGLVDDSRKAYGARADDKAVSWLFDFWEEYVKLPIGQLYEQGVFIRFVAIILQKNPEAARKLVVRYLKR